MSTDTRHVSLPPAPPATPFPVAGLGFTPKYIICRGGFLAGPAVSVGGGIPAAQGCSTQGVAAGVSSVIASGSDVYDDGTGATVTLVSLDLDGYTFVYSNPGGVPIELTVYSSDV